MKTLGIAELQERLNEILRLVQQERETVEVIDQGEVIAHLVPASQPQQPAKRDLPTFWKDIDQLAAEIGAYLPEKVDAVTIVHDVRREL